MKRVAATLALTVFVLGCGLSSEPVPLLTGVPPDVTRVIGAATCSTSEQGPLIVDPKYGTAIIDGPGGPATPVMWRPGFSARRDGAEVAVLDPLGNVVAITGHLYVFEGAYVGARGPAPPPLPQGVFWACGNAVLQP